LSFSLADVGDQLRLEVLADLHAELRAPQPRWTSRIWPTFMRLGTPSGLSTMSTGVPSSRYGMSSSGRMRRDDALVAVAAGHLVADLQLALDGDVDLHHLDDARRQLVALGELGDLLAVVLSIS
jgi:hypothetical protein